MVHCRVIAKKNRKNAASFRGDPEGIHVYVAPLLRRAIANRPGGVRVSHMKPPVKKPITRMDSFTGDPEGNRTPVARMKTWCPNR